MKRKIIVINEELCNGCGLCIPSCPEKALQIVETKNGPKAQLVKEFYCDGLGACLGSCPTGALTIEERAAEPYNEQATIEHIKKVAPEMLEIHFQHLQEQHKKFSGNHSASQLRQWPIQLHLVSPLAPYFQKADLLLAADCVAYALGNFHQAYLKGKAIAIACPKLDEGQEIYSEKIRALVEQAKINTLTVMVMEVPCCRGLFVLAQEALRETKRKMSISSITVSIQGEILSTELISI